MLLLLKMGNDNIVEDQRNIVSYLFYVDGLYIVVALDNILHPIVGDASLDSVLD